MNTSPEFQFEHHVILPEAAKVALDFAKEAKEGERSSLPDDLFIHRLFNERFGIDLGDADPGDLEEERWQKRLREVVLHNPEEGLREEEDEWLFGLVEPEDDEDEGDEEEMDQEACDPYLAHLKLLRQRAYELLTLQESPGRGMILSFIKDQRGCLLGLLQGDIRMDNQFMVSGHTILGEGIEREEIMTRLHAYLEEALKTMRVQTMGRFLYPGTNAELALMQRFLRLMKYRQDKEDPNYFHLDLSVPHAERPEPEDYDQEVFDENYPDL